MSSGDKLEDGVEGRHRESICWLVGTSFSWKDFILQAGVVRTDLSIGTVGEVPRVHKNVSVSYKIRRKT